ncbi:MAG: hypothetical protein QOD34_2534 [Mycobacterium sp.]|nr:hypothetical protein [Mycobacterium sp.]
MVNQRRLLWAAAAGIAVAALTPAALAQADTCQLAECLVSGGKPTDVVYTGFRPLFEDWKDTQPTNVFVPGSSFTDGISGSYAVSEEDYSTSVMDNAIYHFGAFTPAADNAGGLDSGNLAGASLYDFTVGPGGKVVDGVTMYDFNDFSLTLANGNHIEIDTVPGVFTNFLETTANGSGDWIEPWNSPTPQLLFDGLISSHFPADVFNIANYLPPDEWFPVMDSMFPPGLT